ncbi:hypothetical protein H6P81_003204 [Aristolochia fimbriata]|uniref:t-SNARE coiled-coil homology domain-containing protein n=1 Tax=Aristolochia fimbriata TaxID=158543 RepID=A0AAV7FF42_ARIFI|nr:hypothetical protein H6P81_003204 [Aristolochia fimbriata]
MPSLSLTLYLSLLLFSSPQHSLSQPRRELRSRNNEEDFGRARNFRSPEFPRLLVLFGKMNDLMTKSFISYVDLKKSALKDLEAGPDVELEMGTSHILDKNLAQFLEEAGKVKEEMDVIRDILGKLQEANEETKSVHKPEPLKALRTKINSDIVAVLKKARWIRAKLEEMDRANAENRRLSACREGTPVDRTRTSVTNGLRKKLKDLMMDFQALRQKTMSEYKETVERRYFTVTGEVPEEEVIEKIISNGDSEGFLQKAIQEHGRGKVLATVYEIQDRHDAAVEMERSLLELHQVFLDMAVMVEAQGEQMDDIEHHVINAANYVKDGTKNLKTAKDYQRNSRKWMFIGLVLLLILILVVIVPIATSLHNS